MGFQITEINTLQFVTLQVPFFHNIHHPSFYPDTVNIGNIWSPTSQVPKLFGIHHLLGLIRNTLGYNLYMVRYLKLVPFLHNIHYPIQIFLKQILFFCLNFVIFETFAVLPKLFSKANFHNTISLYMWAYVLGYIKRPWNLSLHIIWYSKA